MQKVRSKMKMKLRIMILTLAGMAAAVWATGAADPYRVPGEVVTFDVWKYFDDAGIEGTEQRADMLYFLTSLQGIVNREQPRLYLFVSLALFDIEIGHHDDPDYKSKPVTEIDRYWFEHFRQEGYFDDCSVQEAAGLKELVEYFRSDISGLVLWDTKVPASVNVAMMAAGCEGLLPVSKDLGGGKLWKRLEGECPELKVKLDLAGKFDGKKDVEIDGKKFPTTGSAKNDAYLYAIEKYLRPGLSNPYKMWFNCDASMLGKFRSFYNRNCYGFLGDKNELQQNGMYNADYWVSQKAFIFDLLPWADHTPADDPDQPLGTDNKTWHDILEISYNQREGKFGVAGGFVPWWIKYTSHTGEKHPDVATEWEFVALLTSYNMGNDADAAFGIANSSFFQYMPKVSKEEAKFRDSEPMAYDEEKTYVAVLMLDYDGSAWLNQMVPTIYNDPMRGKMVLNWCLNPILNERIPHVFRYIYKNRTANDCLGLSGDGAAYIQPDSLVNRKGRISESGVPYYESFAKELNERYGVEYNVFYIDDKFGLEWAEMAARITPKGFGFNCPIESQLVNGTPVNFVEMFHISQVKGLGRRLEDLYKNSVEGKYSEAQLHSLRCILIPPHKIYSIVERLDKKYPAAKVEFVDIPNYYRLLKYKLENK